MKFEILRQKERLKIVNQGTLGVERSISKNLDESELAVTNLFTELCPQNDQCIHLINGISSVCNSLAFFCDNNKIKIICGHDDDNKVFAITSLKAEVCAMDLNNCIECKHFESIGIPSAIDKYAEKSQCFC